MGCSQSKENKEIDSERPIQLDRDSKRFETPINVGVDEKPAKSPLMNDPDTVQCITPHEGFCIQTRRVGTNVTFYVNIVHHEKAKSVLGLNIKRSVVDGENCSAYSVVLPSNLFRQVFKHDTPEIKQTALSSIHLINKLFDVHLDLNCEILPAPAYMGDAMEQVWLNLPINVSPNPSEPNTPVKNRHASFRSGGDSPLRQPSVPAMTLPESKPAIAAAPAAVSATPAVSHPTNSAATPAVQHPTAAISPTAVPAAIPHTKPAAEKAVDYNQAHEIPAHEELELVVPAPKPVPPKMHGWLKKRGHVVLNWKSRYFVLDNGYLTYFVDKLDHPPYGKDMKGQLCLAGYREVPITESSTTPPAANRRGSTFLGGAGGDDGGANSHRIHLVYDPTLFDSAQATGNSKGEDFQDLLLEAATSEERSAWIAAISAHTEFFEAGLFSSGGLLKASPLVAITPYQPGEHRSSTASTASPTPSRVMSVTGDNRASTSNYSVVDDNKRWMIFLHSGEEIVLTGLTAKPNPMGIHLMRQLILTSHKRLLYIDGKTMEQKGEIEWSNDITAQYPQIKQIDEMTFEVIESGKKSYKFIAKDMLNATNWVNAVNATVRRF